MHEPSKGVYWCWYNDSVAANEPGETSSLPEEVFKKLQGRKKKGDWWVNYSSREEAILDYERAIRG